MSTHQAYWTGVNQELLEALKNLTTIANLVSQRLHVHAREQGNAGMYDGNYLCSAIHVDLDEATRKADQAIALAEGKE
jgi:hypothetical protein